MGQRHANPGLERREYGEGERRGQRGKRNMRRWSSNRAHLKRKSMEPVLVRATVHPAPLATRHRTPSGRGITSHWLARSTGTAVIHSGCIICRDQNSRSLALCPAARRGLAKEMRLEREHVTTFSDLFVIPHLEASIARVLRASVPRKRNVLLPVIMRAAARHIHHERRPDVCTCNNGAIIRCARLG